MFGILQEIKPTVKKNHVKTDNVIFWLHYRITVLFLIVWNVLISTSQYYGNPIHCMASSDNELYSQAVIDTFCWTHATYTTLAAYEKENPMYPGIDASSNISPKITHAYYQWVGFMLCFQAILFYAPRLLWKCLENNRITGLIQDLERELLEKNKADDQCEILAEHLVNCRCSWNGPYVLSFFGCEFLNFLNDIAQIYLVNVFLGGEFTTYGLRVLDYFQKSPEEGVNPMLKVFPLITKCLFKKTGPGGTTQEHDILCLLPLNIVNEKFYIVFWFWIYLLTPLTALVIIYRAILVLSPRLRRCVFRVHHSLIDPKILNNVIMDFSIGDWFLLFVLGKNIDPHHFRSLINKMAEKLKEPSNNNDKNKSHVRPSKGAEPFNEET